MLEKARHSTPLMRPPTEGVPAENIRQMGGRAGGGWAGGRSGVYMNSGTVHAGEVWQDRKGLGGSKGTYLSGRSDASWDVYLNSKDISMPIPGLFFLKKKGSHTENKLRVTEVERRGEG